MNSGSEPSDEDAKEIVKAKSTPRSSKAVSAIRNVNPRSANNKRSGGRHKKSKIGKAKNLVPVKLASQLSPDDVSLKGLLSYVSKVPMENGFPKSRILWKLAKAKYNLSFCLCDSCLEEMEEMLDEKLAVEDSVISIRIPMCAACARNNIIWSDCQLCLRELDVDNQIDEGQEFKLSNILTKRSTISVSLCKECNDSLFKSKDKFFFGQLGDADMVFLDVEMCKKCLFQNILETESHLQAKVEDEVLG